MFEYINVCAYMFKIGALFIILCLSEHIQKYETLSGMQKDDLFW